MSFQLKKNLTEGEVRFLSYSSLISPLYINVWIYVWYVVDSRGISDLHYFSHLTTKIKYNIFKMQFWQTLWDDKMVRICEKKKHTFTSFWIFDYCNFEMSSYSELSDWLKCERNPPMNARRGKKYEKLNTINWEIPMYI